MGRSRGLQFETCNSCALTDRDTMLRIGMSIALERYLFCSSALVFDAAN